MRPTKTANPVEIDELIGEILCDECILDDDYPDFFADVLPELLAERTNYTIEECCEFADNY